MKFNDIYEFEIGKFMYDVLHKIVPTPLSDLYKPNIMINDHGTRQKNVMINDHGTRRRTL